MRACLFVSLKLLRQFSSLFKLLVWKHFKGIVRDCVYIIHIHNKKARAVKIPQSHSSRYAIIPHTKYTQ